MLRSRSPTSTPPTVLVPSRSISALIRPAAYRSTTGTAAAPMPTRAIDGDAGNDALLHASASGCLAGWAASKAGSCMQAVVDALDGRISLHVDLEACRVEDLRNETEIGHGGRLAMAEGAGPGVVRDRCLVGVEAGLDPVARPAEGTLLGLAEFLAQIAHHAQVLDGMDVGRRDQRQRPDARAPDRIPGQQRRLGMDFLEVFEDGQRLGQHLARIEHQRRHQLLRIDRGIIGRRCSPLRRCREACSTAIPLRLSAIRTRYAADERK